MDITTVHDICRRYSSCAKEYYVGNSIPQHKAQNAQQSLKVPASETILALIDFTVFGSARDAMVITENGLYWKAIAEEPQHLSWNKLKQKTIQETKTLTSKLIEFGDGLKMDLNGASELIKKDNHSVLQLLNDLKELDGNVILDMSPSLNSEDVNGSLVECEFCKSKIKPDVTYCKKCGIKLRG